MDASAEEVKETTPPVEKKTSPKPEYLLWKAANQVDEVLIKSLLEQFPDIDIAWLYNDWDEDNNPLYREHTSALHQIANSPKRESVACFKLLAGHQPSKFDINAKTENGWTALNLACARGHTNIVRYVLETFADKVSYDDDTEFHWSPYWNAAHGDNTDIFMLLVKYATGKSDRKLNFERYGYSFGPIRWRSIYSVASKKMGKLLDDLRHNDLTERKVNNYLKKHDLIKLDPPKKK